MDHISDLPDEIFARILNLVPIKHVIRCSIVSKRWDAACRYIIRTRESLSIGNDYPCLHAYEKRGRDWDRERPSHGLDSVTLANKSLVSAMIKSLNQMEDLTRLCVITRDVSSANFNPFIRKFAKQLTMLEIDFSVSLIGADSFPHLTRLQCPHFDASSSAAFPKLAELLIDGLKQNKELPNMRVPSLKKLLIGDAPTRGAVEVGGFVLANCDNLTILKMRGDRLRLDHAALFPNLTELCCQNVDVAVGCAFPALTHVMVNGSVTAEFLTSLPADQILSLDSGPHGESNLVAAVSRMRNLKSLKFKYNVSAHPDGSLRSIFDNMIHLEKVHFHAYAYGFRKEDEAIATLVNQNPKLSHVYLNGIRVTDAAVTLLAQLQHLTDVTVSFGHRVTTAGVLTLLRGASRIIVRNITIFKANVDGKQVTREISLMCKERDTTFDALHDGRSYHFEYVIHV